MIPKKKSDFYEKSNAENHMSEKSQDNRKDQLHLTESFSKMSTKDTNNSDDPSYNMEVDAAIERNDSISSTDESTSGASFPITSNISDASSISDRIAIGDNE